MNLVISFLRKSSASGLSALRSLSRSRNCDLRSSRVEALPKKVLIDKKSRGFSSMNLFLEISRHDVSRSRDDDATALKRLMTPRLS